MICSNCYSSTLLSPRNDHPSYLECPTCHAIELTYSPQAYQQEIHRIPIRMIWDPRQKKLVPQTQIVGCFGGFGSGKSRASLQEVFLRALESPNGTGLLTAPTLPQLKKTTLKTFFNEIVPPHYIASYNKSEGEIVLLNGFTFYTIPSDDEDKLRSINAGLVHMEEASAIKRSIYDQLLTRMRDPFVTNKLVMVCSNPDLGWIREVFYENMLRASPKHPEHEAYNPQVKCFVWETALNTYLPPDFIQMNSQGKPEWWIKRYLKGSFDHAEGAVYPNFMSTIIERPDVWEKISAIWDKFVAHEHGIRIPTAVLFGAIDHKTGDVHIYDEYYKPNTTLPEHAKAIKPKVEAIPAGLLRFMVTDPASRNRTDPINGKSVQGLYQEYGLFFSEGNNSLDAGLLRVNSYIERGRLKIHRTCLNTIKEGIGYKYPELSMDDEKNLDERPTKFNDHAMDALRYAMMRLPDDPDLLRTDGYAPPKHYKRIQEKEWHDWKNVEDDNEPMDYKDWIAYV